MRHSHCQAALYDYLAGALDEGEHSQIEQHLAACRRCSVALKDLRQTLSVVGHPPEDPAGGKDEAFWQSLTFAIDREINRRKQPKPNRAFALVHRVRSSLALRPAYSSAIAGSLGVALIAAFLVLQPRRSPQTASNDTNRPRSGIMTARDEADQRIIRYFGKSKLLLVGIVNMKTDDGQNIDMSAERKLSRDLVHEARYLKQQPLNTRSARLVNDLEKILIELANLKETGDLPNVELIRSGINQENLLFKIRMAEAAFDTSAPPVTQIIY